MENIESFNNIQLRNSLYQKKIITESENTNSNIGKMSVIQMTNK